MTGNVMFAGRAALPRGHKRIEAPFIMHTYGCTMDDQEVVPTGLRVQASLFSHFCRLSDHAAGGYVKTMEVYLLRHGLAVERGTAGFEDDAARPLTTRGKRQLVAVAAAMKQMGLHFDLILSSPLVRARQTAEIVARELKQKKRLALSTTLAPGGQPKLLAAELTRLESPPETVLLIGHEPDLSRLLSLWTSGGTQLQVDFKKAGLAKLEMEKPAAGKCATLAWLLTPKQMKWMV